MSETMSHTNTPTAAAPDTDEGRRRFAPRRLDLVAGRELHIQPPAAGEQHLTIRGEAGGIELEIVITQSGPRLHFRGAAMVLESTGALELAAEELRLRSRGDIAVEAGGDLEERIAGDRRSRMGGRAETEAHALDLRSRRGNVEIEANDDVRINGERILLNS